MIRSCKSNFHQFPLTGCGFTLHWSLWGLPRSYISSPWPLTYPAAISGLNHPVFCSQGQLPCFALTPAGRQACIILHTPKFGHSWVNVGGCTQAHTSDCLCLPNLIAEIWYILICYGRVCLKMLNGRVCLRTMSLSRRRQIEMYIALMPGNFQPCLLKDGVLKQTQTDWDVHCPDAWRFPAVSA